VARSHPRLDHQVANQARSQTADRRQPVQRVLLLALAVNVLLSLVKLAVGLLSGSLAVLADAIHSATDGVSSLVALLANRLADPRPDRNHPYGHRKAESIGALVIALFILLAAWEILKSAGQRVAAGLEPIQLSWPELGLLLLVLLCNIGLASYEQWQARRLGSSLLRADAAHTRSDVWTSVVVVLGMAGAVALGIPWLDVALALPLCGLMLRASWQVTRHNVPLLIDQVAVAPEAIRAVAMGVPGVLNCHAIASRGMVGEQVFMELHLVVAPTDLATAHQISDQVERRLDAHYGPLRCTVHLEPHDHASAILNPEAGHG
jgi:cation diffusion facilitator family transporter